MNWSKIYNREIVNENPVLGINTVELLEKYSPYLNLKNNYFTRIKESLDYIPNEFKDAALAIFSNVIYIPNDFINATYLYFGSKFKEKYKYNTSEEIGENSHIFEVDPSGLKNKFFQMNSINQRLHPDYYARVDDVTAISRTLNDLFHTDEDLIHNAKKEILKIGKKKHWIILTDKALSGQSLINDIERYLLFRNITQELTGNTPTLEIKAQIITQDAVNSFVNKFGDTDGINIEYSIYFSDKMKVNSENCELFNLKSTQKQVTDLCLWLSNEVMLTDIRFDTMRQKSGDDLIFGYKKCGLTLVDYSNCPTNSIPLLWYNNIDTSNKIKYKGPFPRVQSRLGIQLEQPVGNAWKKIEENKDNYSNKLKEIINADKSQH